jgi:hypothetical protein
METGASAKLQKSCRDTDLFTVLDYTVAAPFANRYSLVFWDSSHFDAATGKRPLQQSQEW